MRVCLYPQMLTRIAFAVLLALPVTSKLASSGTIWRSATGDETAHSVAQTRRAPYPLERLPPVEAEPARREMSLSDEADGPAARALRRIRSDALLRPSAALPTSRPSAPGTEALTVPHVEVGQIAAMPTIPVAQIEPQSPSSPSLPILPSTSNPSIGVPVAPPGPPPVPVPEVVQPPTIQPPVVSPPAVPPSVVAPPVAAPQAAGVSGSAGESGIMGWDGQGSAPSGSPWTAGDCCAPTPCVPRWFGSAGAIMLSRSEPDTVLSRYCDCPDAPVALSATDAAMPMSGGPFLSVGRYLHCGASAVQVTYWGIVPAGQTCDAIRDPYLLESLYSPLNVAGLTYFDGTTNQDVANVTQNAFHQQVWRDSAIQNVEVNFLVFSSQGAAPYACTSVLSPIPYYPSWQNAACCDTSGARLRMTGLAGLRYLYFRESLSFASDMTNQAWGDTPDEIYFGSRIANSLIGFQIGGRAQYVLNPKWSLYAQTKAGVFGNYITGSQSMTSMLGPVTVAETDSPNFGQEYSLSRNDTQTSLVAEFGAGFSWALWQHTSLFAGYQAILATGIAEAVDQLPQAAAYFDQNPIDSSGNLILYGVSFGLMCNW